MLTTKSHNANRHLMTTRSKKENFKPKVFVTTKEPNFVVQVCNLIIGSDWSQNMCSNGTYSI